MKNYHFIKCKKVIDYLFFYFIVNVVFFFTAVYLKFKDVKKIENRREFVKLLENEKGRR
jgi:hypothetical protein